MFETGDHFDDHRCVKPSSSREHVSNTVCFLPGNDLEACILKALRVSSHTRIERACLEQTKPKRANVCLCFFVWDLGPRISSGLNT